MRLTWSRQPSERGLASVCQSPRGADLKMAGEIVGSVRPHPVGFMRWQGWYWYARSEEPHVPLYNTAAEGVPPIEQLDDAKRACEAYVRDRLGLKPRKDAAR